ncbi:MULTISPECIES: outer membrane beta-barrel protein [Chryseobacterium]|uniref:Iron complex outermembrane receptor protein n=1 Tax=Chryseobacterium geocarposphaerae TaxID=1416776 RepID=A0ABU1LHP2_9FLAO|nr:MULTISPECIES: outer membrane beta-barrel protein [Chryseobacterium]MDR6406253.1 iron complex outermembrane receptor protein [Chryseobacterium geocarposphaerae]MDR6699727.1 iron complex outermembrane receptor protein [Chryseobacterium ginsenosidimutans]
MKGLFFLGLTVGSFAFLQAQNTDSLKIREIEAVNFTKRLPVAKEIINVAKDIDSRNLGQDLPILLKNQTSIISTSDAGNGVGYTGFRIRGVAGNGINVMMNGVPYNDSESQGTFFVNVPDLTSSASQIVIQRGVGTSNNGAAAFGASINVLSKDPEEKFYFKTDDSYGSFNTYKYSAEIGSGKFWGNRLSVMGRYTHINSDGYIDRAFSKLDSYNFTALYEEGKTRIRLMAFGGKEKTYQAWNGIDRKTWETDPKFNYSGAIYDANWENIVGFYDNETDNYRQNHYQLLWEQKFNDRWNLETTLHYTKGKGYYENYKQGDPFARYNLADINGEEYSDFIRKKWLNNDFYGLVSTLYGKFENLDLNFGIVGNQYYGRHFGNVTGVFFPEIDEHEYYRNRSVKNEVAGFAKALIRVNNFEFFGDLQLRNIDYDTRITTEGDDEGANLDKNWLFFNPKAGVNYRIPQGKIFFSYAHAHREPNRDDLLANNDVKAEKLHDFEAGLEKQFGIVSFTANLYYMYYVNQLVLNGELNNVGAFIRTNSGKSYRSGIELGALAKLSKQWEVTGNVSFSNNRNLDFKVENEGSTKDLGNTQISFSPDVIANLGVKFNPTKNFQFALMNQYVGKQYLDNSEDENLQLKDYLLTDFNAQYQFKIKNNDIALKLLVNNIFNKKYVNNGAVYDGTPYYFSQAGTNFMFGISWKIQ